MNATCSQTNSKWSASREQSNMLPTAVPIHTLLGIPMVILATGLQKAPTYSLKINTLAQNTTRYNADSANLCGRVQILIYAKLKLQPAKLCAIITMHNF